MKVVQCNKCNKARPEKDLYSNETPWVDGHISGQHMNVYFDLCGNCGTKLAEYVKKFFGIKGDKKAS